MSFDSSGAYEQRLLPAAIEDRLVGWFGRAGGITMLATTAVLWASFISWSVADPSLTHATGGSASNVLGIPGAIVSDLLLQTLGIGAVLAILAPTLWALELIGAQRIRDFRAKISFYPLSVLILAGGLSALPTAAGWPLNHGYGGILGDLIYGLASSTFGILNPDRGGLAAGLVLFISGGAALLTSIGLEIKDLAAIVARPQQPYASEPAPNQTFASAQQPRPSRPRWFAWPFRRAATTSAAAVAHGYPHYAVPAGYPTGYGAPHYPMHPQQQGWAHEWQSAPPGGHYAQPQQPMMGARGYAASGDLDSSLSFSSNVPLPGSRADWGRPDHDDGAPSYTASMPANSSTASRPNVQSAAGQNGVPAVASATPSALAHDDNFDASTDAASRTIAERFAPAGARGPVAPGAQSPAAVHAPRKLGPGLLGGMSFRRNEPAYKRPSLNLLKRPAASKPGADYTPAMQRGTARLLEDVLADFGVKGEIKDIRPGPVVTLFEFEPARGTKSSRIIALADDIARSMSATAVRVAVVPGRNAIGIELPNARRETVLLREILEAESFRTTDAALPITLGKSIGGEPVITDLARMPHLLVAGTTGSGKSVGVNTMILSLLFRHTPEDCRFLMIDPKMLELSVYNGIPHLLTPVVTDPQKAVAALNWAVREMEERYKRMSQLAVRNIDVFNNRVRNAKKRGELMKRTVQTGFDKKSGQPIYEQETLALEPLPYIVIVVDEFADLMVVAGKEIEAAVQRLAQMARAAGIHLIMATQRPSVDIVTGTIKANFPTRISFKVASKIDSRTILNDQGAEQLLGQGDMLFAGSSGGQPIRVHGAFVADEEVEGIVAFLKSQGAPRYVEGVTDVPDVMEMPANGDASPSEDDLYDRAVAVVLRDGKASTSYVQRRLSIGYNRAADLIERMEREGLISPANAVGKRDILAGRDHGGSHAA